MEEQYGCGEGVVGTRSLNSFHEDSCAVRNTDTDGLLVRRVDSLTENYHFLCLVSRLFGLLVAAPSLLWPMDFCAKERLVLFVRV